MQETIIIRRKSIRIEVADEPAALRVRQQLNDVWLQGVMMALEQRLKPMNLKGKTVFIPAIKINLKPGNDTLRPNEWVESLADKIAEQIWVHAAQYTGRSPEELMKPAAAAAEPPIHALHSDRYFEALRQYLLQGSFPWWSRHTKPSPAEWLLQQYANTTTGDAWLNKMLAELKNISIKPSADPYQRLAGIMIPMWRQLGTSGWLQEHTGFSFQQIAAVIQALSVVLGRTPNLLWAALLAAQHSSAGAYLSLGEQPAAHQKKPPMPAWVLGWYRQMEAWGNTIVPDDEKDAPKGWRVWQQCLQSLLLNKPASDRQAETALPEKEIQASADTKEPALPSPEATPEARGWYTPHAGLIILHPFCERLFAAQGWLDADKQFVQESNHHKAVKMMAYMSGEEAPEWECVLEKVLCGLEPETFVDMSEPLKPEEEQACRELLEAAKGYWPPMRGSSVEAMQGTTLLRRGKLEQVETGWQLHVERNGTDILLEQLPWSIRVVRLPWMKHPLYVQW
jgi:hypothetical protein